MLAAYLTLVFFIMGLATIPEFMLNAYTEINTNPYDSIDNFYDLAPCNEVRPLRPEVLLKAGAGKSYAMMWVSRPFHTHNLD